MNVLSDEYFDWIEENTKDKIINNFNLSDQRYVKLEILFLTIDEYAKKNYLFDCEEYRNKYIIKYGKSFYEVGVMYGEESMYYVRKLNPSKVFSYFDIDDVRNNTIRGRDNLEINYIMNEIIDGLDELNKRDVPLDLVEDEIHAQIIKLSLKR